VTEVRLLDPTHPGGARRIGPNPAYNPADPHPGKLALFTGTHLLAGGALWTAYDDDPGTIAGKAIKVARMDLRTGQVGVWYAAPRGDDVGILGPGSQGLPVLEIAPITDERITVTPPPTPPETLVQLTGPNQTAPVAGPELDQYWTTAVADAHGTWITSQDALWLFSGGHLEQVATMPGPVPRYGLRLAGGCR
jgi:hypothetical protein